LRTIYMCHALALFITNSNGTYIKPTESLSENAYNIIKKHFDVVKCGFWIWICSTKDSDINLVPIKQRKSYIIGAIYVSGIVETNEFRKKYRKERAMREFIHSKGDEYQMIVPMRKECRIELKEYIDVDAYRTDGGENRQHGAWMAREGSELYDKLERAMFV